MLSLIQSIFGSYVPSSYSETVLYWDPSSESFVEVVNTIVPSGLSGVDWPWVSGVFLFGIVLYCFLRIVGGCICGGK